MTEGEVIRALLERWSPWRYRVLPHTVNVAGWEADLLIVQPSGYVEEIEVKVSVADFRAELANKSLKHEQLEHGRFKSKWCHARKRFILDRDNPQPHSVRRFWFAMPMEILDKIRPDIPAWAGVLAVKESMSLQGGIRRTQLIEVRSPKILKMAQKLTPEQYQQLLESCYHKYWRAYGFKELK